MPVNGNARLQSTLYNVLLPIVLAAVASWATTKSTLAVLVHEVTQLSESVKVVVEKVGDLERDTGAHYQVSKAQVQTVNREMESIDDKLEKRYDENRYLSERITRLEAERGIKLK